jgi:hypothetical protein
MPLKRMAVVPSDGRPSGLLPKRRPEGVVPDTCDASEFFSLLPAEATSVERGTPNDARFEVLRTGPKYKQSTLQG